MMGRDRWRGVMRSGWSLLLAAGALWVIGRELSAYHYHEVTASLRGFPASRLLLALLLTALSYAVQTTYDVLGLRYVGQRLRYAQVALASFMGQALGNTIGNPIVGGAPPRVRIYAAAGLSPLDIAKLVAFVNGTFVVGFLALGGIVFLAAPLALPARLGLPLATSHPLGIAFLAACALYIVASVAASARGRRGARVALGQVELMLPAPGLALAQVATAAVDCLLSASVLYVLLAPSTDLSFPTVLGAYLLALVAGLVSFVPGGIGVFESAVVLLLGERAGGAGLAAALVANRIIYYLLPLGASVLLLAGDELARRRAALERMSRFLGNWISWIAPQLLAITTLIGGTLLLVSGATPAEKERLAWLARLLPLPVLEMSHFAASVIGTALLILARGLQRRLDAAYVLTAFLLAAGALTSLLKGLDYEEALILTGMLAVLLPCREYFYRRTSLFSSPFTLGWTAAVIGVVAGSIWLGLFAYKHVEYSHDLWWQFAAGRDPTGDASRFLRASVGGTLLLLMFAVGRLLKPARPPVRPVDLTRVRALVDMSADTEAYLALLGDKSFLFSESGNAFIMYGMSGPAWVTMGDPVGAEAEWAELVWRFRELCAQHEAYPAFLQVRAAHLPLYLELGLTVLKLGEEARVRLAGFSLEGAERAGLRQAHRRAEREGLTFTVLPAVAVPGVLGELREISDAWLGLKETREKSFSLGSFSDDYLVQCPVAIVRRADDIIAFANLWAGTAREEAAMDLMRHGPSAPRGVMDYLFVELLLWAQREGYRWFNLGLAPLSGLESRAEAPLWNRIAALAFRHGEHFYNFQGLRQYKEKFLPVWEPRYLVAPGGLALPRVLAAIATLTSGGVAGIVGK